MPHIFFLSSFSKWFSSDEMRNDESETKLENTSITFGKIACFQLTFIT